MALFAEPFRVRRRNPGGARTSEKPWCSNWLDGNSERFDAVGTECALCRSALFEIDECQNAVQSSGDIMSTISIDDLREDLQHRHMAETRGGIWDYSNRLGFLGEHIETSRNPPTLGGSGMSIEDAANAGDDSSFYPGLTPLR
jgi:hypothetical protein